MENSPFPTLVLSVGQRDEQETDKFNFVCMGIPHAGSKTERKNEYIRHSEVGIR